MTPTLPFILIDDDPINNFICKELIIANIKQPLEINEFEDAEAALEFVSEIFRLPEDIPFAIIFLDLNMPLISGWDFLREFDQLSDEIRSQFEIYVISSSPDPYERSRAMADRNVKDFMSKPIPDEFLQEIGNRFLRPASKIA